MSAYNVKKEHILWVGEHAKALYSRMNKGVLDKYDNDLLMYERNDEDELLNVTYLNKATNRYLIDYDVESMKEPVSDYLHERKIERNTGLIIGSPYELLMQSVLKSSHVRMEKSVPLKASFLVEKSFQSLPNRYHSSVDLTRQSILFLASDIPFIDLKKEGVETMEKARQIFSTTIIADTSVQDLSEFLFRYHEDHAAALQETKGITSL